MARRRGRTSASGRTSATPPATLAAAVHALAALPGARLAPCRGSTRPSPVGVADQPEFRNAVGRARRARPGPSPATGAVGPADRPQGHRARVRPPAARALGAARGRPRPAAVRRRRWSRSSDRRGPEPTTRPRPRCRWSSRTPRRGTACSSWRRSADLAPGLVPPGWDETVAAAAAPAARGRGPGRRPADRDAGTRERLGPACLIERARRLEPDGRRAVPVEHVDGVDEADLLALVGHHERVGARAAAEEADALEQVAGR